jgi:hypothetical protein
MRQLPRTMRSILICFLLLPCETLAFFAVKRCCCQDKVEIFNRKGRRDC